MRNTLQRYIIVLLLIMMFVSGCAPTVEEQQPPPPPASQFSLEEIQAAIRRARENFDVIKSLQVHETYAHDFEEAQSELQNAERLLQEDLRDDAFASAQKSLEASHRILRQFYQQNIARSAQETRDRIQQIAEEDPDNLLQDFIPELNQILDYSDEIDRGQQLVDLEKLLDDLDKVKQIEYNTRTNASKILESDVSFGLGKYELSDEGKRLLEEWNQDIIRNKNEFKELYSESRIVIKLKVIGYTDSTGFKKGTRLLKKLKEGVEVPTTYPEQRKFLNQRLSEFRARTISEYLVQLITQDEGEDSQIVIEQEIVGLGEELPPALPSPGYEDPRRRMCKIYSSITTR